jgi:hypothetical protein
VGEEIDPDERTLGPWLAETLRRHWIFVGALLAHVALWLFVPAVWSRTIKVYGGYSVQTVDMRGYAMHAAPGALDVFIVIVGTILFIAGGAEVPLGTSPGGAADLGVVQWMARAAGVVGICGAWVWLVARIW